MLRTAQRSINRWSKSAWHLPCAWPWPTARRGLATSQVRQGSIHKLVFAAVCEIQDDMAAGKRKFEVIRAPEIVKLARDHPMVGKKLKSSELASLKEQSELRHTDGYRGLMELLNQRFRLLGPEDIQEDRLADESTPMDGSDQSAGYEDSSLSKPQQPSGDAGHETIELARSHEKSEQDIPASDTAVENGRKKDVLSNGAANVQESLGATISNSKHKHSPDTELSRVFSESRKPTRLPERTHGNKANLTDNRCSGVKWVDITPGKVPTDEAVIEQGQAVQDSLRQTRVKLEETYHNALYLISLLPTNNSAKSEFIGGNQSDASPDQVHRRKDMLNRIGIREVTKLRGRSGLGEGGALDLKSPQRRMRYIHIAGTKGKGSVANYITSILTSPVGIAAGKIGTYTSPHINTVRERIKIDGEMLSEEEFTKQFFQFWRVLRRSEPREQDLPRDLFIPKTWLKDYEKRLQVPQRLIAVRSAPLKTLYAQEEVMAASRMPFLFNFMTLFAMRVFQTMRVKTAVVECGIGAEYDTTNVLIPPSDVSVGVVTAIDYEHMSMLGTSLPEIAWHKSGVFKPGASAVVVRPPISATTFDFMHGMTQGSYVLPKPRQSSTADVKEAGDNAHEQRLANEADGNAVMGVIWGRAIDRAVHRLVDVPFDVGMPDASAPPDQINVGGPVEKLNMAVASLAVNEHFHQLQLSRTQKAEVSLNESEASANELTEQTSIQLSQSAVPYQARIRSLSLSPYLSRGHWQAMVKPTHLSAMAFSKSLPGRREVYKSPHDQHTTIYLDGAHTANSLRAVGQWFQDQVTAASGSLQQEQLSSPAYQPLPLDMDTNTNKPLVVIIFDQRDRDRDPIALFSALLEPLRSSGSLFNKHTLAFVGLIRPQSGSNEVFDKLQREFEAEFPWLRFRHFEHIDHATAKAAAIAREYAAADINGGGNNWWPQPVHVLATGSFSLTSRSELRDPTPVLFNMPSVGSVPTADCDDPASRVETVMAELLAIDRGTSRRRDILRKRRLAMQKREARIRGGGVDWD